VDVNKIFYKHKVGEMTFYDIKGRERTKHEPESVGMGVVK
jgi:hypothetical protein